MILTREGKRDDGEGRRHRGRDKKAGSLSIQEPPPFRPCSWPPLEPFRGPISTFRPFPCCDPRSLTSARAPLPAAASPPPPPARFRRSPPPEHRQCPHLRKRQQVRPPRQRFFAPASHDPFVSPSSRINFLLTLRPGSNLAWCRAGQIQEEPSSSQGAGRSCGRSTAASVLIPEAETAC